MRYAVIYEKTDTVEQTSQLMLEAIEFHLAGMQEDGDTIPEPTTVAAMVPVGSAV